MLSANSHMCRMGCVGDPNGRRRCFHLCRQASAATSAGDAVPGICRTRSISRAPTSTCSSCSAWCRASAMSAAADRLGLTPSAVSHGLGRLRRLPRFRRRRHHHRRRRCRPAARETSRPCLLPRPAAPISAAVGGSVDRYRSGRKAYAHLGPEQGYDIRDGVDRVEFAVSELYAEVVLQAHHRLESIAVRWRRVIAGSCRGKPVRRTFKGLTEQPANVLCHIRFG